MLFRDVGGIDRASMVAPARAHVGAKCGDLLVIETDAQFEATHLRPGVRAEHCFVRPVQHDIDEGGGTGRLERRIAGQWGRGLRGISAALRRVSAARAAPRAADS